MTQLGSKNASFNKMFDPEFRVKNLKTFEWKERLEKGYLRTSDPGDNSGQHDIKYQCWELAWSCFIEVHPSATGNKMHC